MNIYSCYCRNCHCRLSGLVGAKARLRLDDWHRGVLRSTLFRFQAAGFGSHRHSHVAFAPMNLTHRYGAAALAEGLALRADGRLFAIDKDTLCRWLLLLSAHCQGVMSYFFRDLHLNECFSLGTELWTFIYKEARAALRSAPRAGAGCQW